MLVAYHRARSQPNGERLMLRGLAVVRPIAEAALADADPQFLSDLELIHGHVVRAAIARFADGEIEVTEILPILELTLFRLLTDQNIGAKRTRTQTTSLNKASSAARGRRTNQKSRHNLA